MHFVSNIFLLNGFVQSWQTPEGFSVVMRWILGHQVGSVAIQRFAVLRNRIREVPHHSTRFGVTKWMTTMIFHHDTNHAA